MPAGNVRLERERIGPGRHEVFHKILNEPAGKYLAERNPPHNGLDKETRQ